MSVYTCVLVSESHRYKSIVEQTKEDISMDTICIILILAALGALIVFICRSHASDERKDTEEQMPDVKVVDHVLEVEDHIKQIDDRNAIRDPERCVVKRFRKSCTSKKEKSNVQ